jgi:HD-GYP domain-containing protein (c-di-GMP phosphodiesterase class II)
MMNSSRKESTRKTSIHGVLVLRLAVAALVIAIVLGLTVFFRERGKVGEAITERALQGARHFNAKITYLLDVPGLPDHEGLQRELETLASGRLKLRSGYFVSATLHDTDARKLAQLVDREYKHSEAVEKLLNSVEQHFPIEDENGYRFVRIGGSPHVLVTAPLTNTKGDTVAYLQGVFAVSEAVVSDVYSRIVRTVFAVIGIVLVSTALLYPVIVALMRKVTRISLQLLDSNLEILRTLGSAVAKRDSDTDIHNYRVTIIAVGLAEAVGLDRQTIQSLIKGAFLHDVGKIGVPDKILLKPGRLTEDEFQVMKTHVNHGLDIVNRSAWLTDARDVVGEHHEKYDASGYLKGVGGKEIPITARIFAIADVFDALTSKRPYKEPFSFEDAMEILEKGRGSHFDSVLLDAFAQIAKMLYDELTGSGEEMPKKKLDAIIQEYFAGDFSLLYG